MGKEKSFPTSNRMTTNVMKLNMKERAVRTFGAIQTGRKFNKYLSKKGEVMLL
jgi:hypothetical protein